MRGPTLGKLRGRSVSELIDCARQGASRWLERRGLGDLGEPHGARWFREDSGSAPAIRGANLDLWQRVYLDGEEAKDLSACA